MDIVEKARILATAAHHAVNQTRKYTGAPYIDHPQEVVHWIQHVQHTPSMLAAAWLHDTVEDTGITLELIESEFGSDIAALVEMLTDVSTSSDGNRSVRKAKDRDHIAAASPEAKTIKLADLLSNTRSIIKHDKQFAKVYMKEMAQLLTVLVEGDALLLEYAHRLLTAYEEGISQSVV